MPFDDRLSTAKSRFLNAMLSGNTLVELIKMGEEMLKRPVILSTINHFVWYSGNGVPQDVIAPQTGLLAAAIDSCMKEDGTTVRDPGNKGFVSYKDSTYFYNFCFISWKGHIRGYSCIVDQNEFSADDCALHVIFCKMLAEEIEKQNLLEQALLLSREELMFMQMLEDPHFVADSSLLNKLSLIDSKSFQIVVATHLDTLGKMAPDITLIGKLRKMLNCEICFGYMGNIVSLTRSGQAFALQHTLGEFLRAEGMVAGVSYPFTNIAALRCYYEQAQKAANASWRFGKKRMMLYAEHVFADISSDYSSKYPVEEICNPGIVKLVSSDKQNKTNLAETLLLYLEPENNISSIAQDLGVHRNTISARLQKIREINSGTLPRTIQDLYSLVVLLNKQNDISPQSSE